MSSILFARAARKQTTTSGTTTTYYYHHHTVQVTILRPPHAFLDGNDCHHHRHTVQVSMHTFSICTIALEEKTPLPPPPHSASYNITATTTCASRVSALVGHRKRPPVQVTVATTTCASRVSVLAGIYRNLSKNSSPLVQRKFRLLRQLELEWRRPSKVTNIWSFRTKH